MSITHSLASICVSDIPSPSSVPRNLYRSFRTLLAYPLLAHILHVGLMVGIVCLQIMMEQIMHQLGFPLSKRPYL